MFRPCFLFVRLEVVELGRRGVNRVNWVWNRLKSHMSNFEYAGDAGC